MDINLRINGLLVEGLGSNSVKLNLSNADPIKFTDPTVSYSGSIRVPRTEVNDRVFRSELAPFLFVRERPYIAELTMGGVPVPVGSGFFSARVTASRTEYSIELVETFTKLENYRLPLWIRPLYRQGTNDTAAWWISYQNVLNRYGVAPAITTPTVTMQGKTDPLQMMYIADPAKPNRSGAIGAMVDFVFLGSHDGATGAVYPRMALVPTSTAFATSVNWESVATVNLNLSRDSYIVVSQDYGANIYMHNTRAAAIQAFSKAETRADGLIVYRAPTTITTLQVAPNRGNEFALIFRTTTSIGSQQISPATSIPVAEGCAISLEITSISGGGTELDSIVDNVQLSTTADIVKSFCKAFCWTYSIIDSPLEIRFSEFINPDTSATYRVNWTGKVDEESITVSEMANTARTMSVQVGAVNTLVGGFPGAINTQITAAESQFPAINLDGGGPRPYAQMARRSGSVYIAEQFFTRPTGHRATISKHYNRFSKGWQVSCKANLTYFDIKNFKRDALYFVPEMLSWFYVKDIKNWNPSDGSCSLTLIAVNN